MYTQFIKDIRSDGKKLVDAACLSTDTKVTADIANGSNLVEINTGKVYFFDEDGGAWTEFGG